MKSERTSEIFRFALITDFIRHDHSPHSLLDSVLRDISQDFEQNFVGMTDDTVTLDTSLFARDVLIADINSNMPENHKEFLIPFYIRKSHEGLFAFEGIDAPPAIRWRALNLDQAGEGTREELVKN